MVESKDNFFGKIWRSNRIEYTSVNCLNVCVEKKGNSIMEYKKLLKMGAAARYLGVNAQTLRNWHSKKILVPELVLTSGHRFYTKEQLDKFMAENNMLVL